MIHKNSSRFILVFILNLAFSVIGCSLVTKGWYTSLVFTEKLLPTASDKNPETKTFQDSYTPVLSKEPDNVFALSTVMTSTGSTNEALTPTVNPLMCLPKDTESEFGLVKWISDGDSIVLDIQSQLYNVRYLGIDAPGVNPIVEYRGPNAARFNQQLVDNQLVRLVRDGVDQDPSGYLLRYVLIGDLFVNYEMVRQGMAAPDTQFYQISCQEVFLQAAEVAKQESLGIWAATRTPYLPGESSGTPAGTIQPTFTGTITPTMQITSTSQLTPTATATLSVTVTSTSTPTITPSVTLTTTRTLTATASSNQ